MLEVTAAGWAATLATIAGLLALDWFTLGRHPQPVGLAAAARWSLFYIAIALAFGVVFSIISGWDVGTQYFAGYVVEESLSVDNLFMFVIIIGSFAVPASEQPKAVTLGITMALVLRAGFIAVGAALIQAFTFMFLVFGVALIITAVQLFRHRNEDPSTEDNFVVALARRVLPLTTSFDAGRLVVRRGSRRVFTPLLLALIAIGSTDLLFAFDSVPAVFGITSHGYIVFAVNAFALLGLRPMFFLVRGLLDRLVYMSAGLAAILAFIGGKLVLEFAHHENAGIPTVSTGASLIIVVAVLAITAVASLFEARRDPARRAHPGSLRRRRADEPPPPQRGERD